MRTIREFANFLGLTKMQPVTAGMFLAFGAAMAYGTSQVVAKQMVTEVASPLVASLFALIFGALVLVVFVHRDIPEDLKAPPRAFVLIGLAGICSSAGIALLFVALSLEPVVVISPMIALNPLFALLFTHVFLQQLERVTPRIVVGTLLVVSGLVCVAIDTAI